jgi:His-Xaa-Ser system radical SAM maturase HxsC
MCSQPPKDVDDVNALTKRNLDLLNLIEERPPSFMTISGGEPTLLGDSLFCILANLKTRFANTDFHMLTNGRRFAWRDFTTAFSEVCPDKLTLGIPVYSDNAVDHDFVVQAKGAFDQTIVGLHNLARYGHRVEIRVVLHAQTIRRLPKLAEYIYRNLTFVDHVALMGMEHTGFAPRNMNLLWIDPYDYQAELFEAVRILRERDIRVSIYNHQLCLLRPEIRKFAVQSISDWKNVYLECCDFCSLKSRCGGFFQWSTKYQSSHIEPVS